MKKIFSLLSICIASLLLFAGCGIEGGTQPTGIEFVREVFYVDYNVSTFLDYKVYPSTAVKDYVTYDLEADYTLEDSFEFRNGAIKVTDSNFTSIIVKARLNSLEASCEVKLKEYPTIISLDSNPTTIDAGLVKYLDLVGSFKNGPRSCGNAEFEYRITSNNPSVIEVVDESNLSIRSTGRSGEATITVKIYNSVGEEMTGLSDSITLSVIDSIESSYATFGNLFVIKDGDQTTITIEEGQEALEEKISIRYFSSRDFLIKLADFDVLLSNDNVFEVVNKADGVYLKLKDKAAIELDGENKAAVVLTLRSTATDQSGSLVSIQTTIYVQFL